MKKLLNSGTAPSAGMNFGLGESISSRNVTTAKLDMIRSALPASQTLYKNNRGEHVLCFFIIVFLWNISYVTDSYLFLTMQVFRRAICIAVYT